MQKQITFCFAAILAVWVPAGAQNAESLQARIAELEAQVAELVAENAELREQLNGGEEQAGIVYLEQPRTTEWLDEMYAKYGDKIIIDDHDKYRDIGREVLTGGSLDRGSWYAVVDSLPITHISGPTSMLIERAAVPGRYKRDRRGRRITVREPVTQEIVQIAGINTSGYKAGETYSGIIVRISGFAAVETPREIYGSASAKEWREHVPLRREQFIDALDSGFTLAEHTLDEDGNVATTYEY